MYDKLNVLVEKITSHFTRMLKSADHKITNISKLDKDSWQVIDEIGEKCKAWIKEVEQIRDEQVSFSKIKILRKSFHF